MELQTSQERHPAPYYGDEDARARAEDNLWVLLGALYRRRLFIIAVTVVMAVLSVGISLSLANWYRASSRLLLPEGAGGGGLASALLGDLSSAAQSLLGGGGDYIRYMAILSSRSMSEELVDAFNLIQVYDLEDSENPLAEAVETLGDNVEFVVDDEYEFLSIEVLDRDPQRAADMANYYVNALNRINGRLTSHTAGNFRKYVEERYEESQRTRGALLDSLQAFQSRYGVFDLEAQTQAFFDQMAEMRTAAVATEIELGVLRAQLGPNSAQVKALEAAVEATDQKFQEALAGREMVLPVPRNAVPTVVRQYLDIEMERVIQERILELVAPMLEQARFEEQREAEVVQVLDEAVPPVKKAKPKRSVICVAATLSALILAVLYVLAMDWWRRNHAYFARRLQQAGDAPTLPRS